MHTYETTLRLGQTDSAGIAYYVSVFDIIHECYESFLDIAAILKEGKYLLPIVHAEADYRAMMELSDRIRVEMELGGTGRSSYTLVYRLVNQRGEVVADAKTIHSVLDRESRKSIEMPDYIRNRFNEL
ncbi:MAG: thioesterase family protein [Phycisphaerae bacterium]|nr:thioesterase family protein [Phycisphaerae bacterium]